jgi:spermidine synthase
MNAVFRTFLSYICGLQVDTVDSALNGKLEVWYTAGKYKLDSAKANYSFGALHRLFQKVFREIDLAGRNPGALLLLGLGAGSVVSIVRKELQLKTVITGVEHDEKVIQLSKKYFGIERYIGLNIVQEDAAVFIQVNDQKFDCIVIDLFHDRDVPEKFMQKSFLDHCFRHLSVKGILIFNFISANVRQKEEFELLKQNITTLGKEFRVLELMGDNKVIISLKGQNLNNHG